MNEEKSSYEFIDWNKLQNLIKILAKKVKESEYKPDVIIGISKGGWVVSRLLCDYIDCKDIISLELKQSEKISLSFLNKNLLEKRILLVDDVIDEKSMQSIKSIIPLETNRVRILSLFYTKGNVKPDYYIEEVSNTIKFPWNLESIRKN
ncbi:MAG: phosphoribosyltransferase family protein [Nitrososphaerales archaeon]